jgi:HD-like signal output (HDOD) protein
MNTEALVKRLGGKLNLPSLPEVVVQVQSLVKNAECSMGEIGAAIAGDPPLAARVLRMANSSYYSLRAPVIELHHAAAILGLDALANLVMQVAIADMFRHLGKGGLFNPREMWTHSVLTAQIAGCVPGRFMSGFKSTEAHMVGLFHDIGKFVLFDSLRGEYADAVTLADKEGVPQDQKETELFGFNHAEVGELVTKRWGLPKMAIRAIADHHTPTRYKTGGMTAVVALANHIAKDVATMDPKAEGIGTPLSDELANCMSIDDEDLEALYERAKLLWMDLKGFGM